MIFSFCFKFTMMTQQPPFSFAQILGPYKQLIEQRLQENVEQLGPKSPLRDACEYALLNGGKRFRPALVLMIAKALGHEVDVLQAAMGIEFFHTASLIADDLPCMDNDDERRNKPTVHRVYGESIALLATYALISAGYGCLAKNAQLIKHSSHPFAHQSHHLCVLALENAIYNTGLHGATGGQFLDLSPPNLSLSLLREVIHKKTVTLFEISFVLGWLFGGGDLAKLDLVKKSAAHFGMAFQIADDLDDMAQDLAHQHSLNIANVLGKEQAKAMFHEEMQQFDQLLQELNLDQGDLQALARLLVYQVQQM
jgi:geranylgeranyl diphosphate synthase type II